MRQRPSPHGAHFLTAVTHDRRPYFARPECARIFCEELEAARLKYGFEVWAFVVMLDHVHLLLWWLEGWTAVGSAAEGNSADGNAVGGPPIGEPIVGRPEVLTISKVAWAVKGKSARRIVDFLKGAGTRTGEGIAFADPAFADPAFADPAFADPAFADPAFADPAFADPAFADPANPANPLIPARQPRDQAHYRQWHYKIWQQGAGYDFIAYSRHKLAQKINYIHANPVRAGLAATAEEYGWSSAANYRSLPAAHSVQVTMPF